MAIVRKVVLPRSGARVGRILLWKSHIRIRLRRASTRRAILSTVFRRHSLFFARHCTAQAIRDREMAGFVTRQQTRVKKDARVEQVLVTPPYLVHLDAQAVPVQLLR